MKLIFCMIILLIGCNSYETPSDSKRDSLRRSEVVDSKPAQPHSTVPLTDFDRAESLKRLKGRVETGKTLVVHVMVPLCDNEHQGIVPVSKALGNGRNLKTNLYWGARYGIKRYMDLSADWKRVYDTLALSSDVLERVAFTRSYPNGAKVLLVCDAYAGDKMAACLQDLMRAIAGDEGSQLVIDDQIYGIGSQADLIVFNGHNGLMDVVVDPIPSSDQVIREVSVIGCVSHNYFKDHLRIARGYPLLMTTNLMAPEAYVLEGVVNAWAMLETGADIRLAAGRAYHAYQKCGIRGATNLFRTGW